MAPTAKKSAAVKASKKLPTKKLIGFQNLFLRVNLPQRMETARDVFCVRGRINFLQDLEEEIIQRSSKVKKMELHSLDAVTAVKRADVLNELSTQLENVTNWINNLEVQLDDERPLLRRRYNLRHVCCVPCTRWIRQRPVM